MLLSTLQGMGQPTERMETTKVNSIEVEQPWCVLPYVYVHVCACMHACVCMCVLIVDSLGMSSTMFLEPGDMERARLGSGINYVRI